MTEESIRLTVAEMWTEELLALVERAARPGAIGICANDINDLARDASRLLRRIDALEVPDRPKRKRTVALEEGSFW